MDFEKVKIWMLLSNFNTNEAWGEPEAMDPFELVLIDRFRGRLPKGCWIKVHCGYKSRGHNPNSYHYKGLAVDFHVVGCTLLEAEAHLMKFLKEPHRVFGQEIRLIDYVGIGIYPDWSDPGFHIDLRGTKASWARIAGKYVAYDLGIKQAKTLNL